MIINTKYAVDVIIYIKASVQYNSKGSKYFPVSLQVVQEIEPAFKELLNQLMEKKEAEMEKRKAEVEMEKQVANALDVEVECLEESC